MSLTSLKLNKSREHKAHLTRISDMNVQVDNPAQSFTNLGPEKQRKITLKIVHIKSNYRNFNICKIYLLIPGNHHYFIPIAPLLNTC